MVYVKTNYVYIHAASTRISTTVNIQKCSCNNLLTYLFTRTSTR